jgi:hypothetical protein
MFSIRRNLSSALEKKSYFYYDGTYTFDVVRIKEIYVMHKDKMKNTLFKLSV